MSIRVRHGKWVVDYYPAGQKGKRVRLTLSEWITTEEQARGFERDLVTASRQTDLTPPSNAVVKELFTTYLDWYKIHRAESTYLNIKGVPIPKHLGHIRVDDLNPQYINIYKKARLAEGVCNRTITKELSYLGGFLTWAERNGYAKQHQWKIEKLPYKRPIPIVLSREEVMRIIGAAEPFYRVFIICLYSAGLRLSEARNLRWEDLDYANRILKVKQKGGDFKVLPLNDWLISSLETIKPDNPVPEVFVFKSKRTRGHIHDARKAIERARVKAGITKHIGHHTFRHSIATHLMTDRHNLRVIQEYLGHKSQETTSFYTHVTMEHLREAGDDISRGALLNRY